MAPTLCHRARLSSKCLSSITQSARNRFKGSIRVCVCVCLSVCLSVCLCACADVHARTLACTPVTHLRSPAPLFHLFLPDLCNPTSVSCSNSWCTSRRQRGVHLVRPSPESPTTTSSLGLFLLGLSSVGAIHPALLRAKVHLRLSHKSGLPDSRFPPYPVSSPSPTSALLEMVSLLARC